jgi:putative heme iron utilization protein
MDPARAQSMIAHMNTDHADSLKAYLRHYTRLHDAATGELTAISLSGMTITATLATVRARACA